MPRKEQLAHFFGGLLAGLIIIKLPLFTLLLTAIFILYELDESYRISDEAFKDIREFLYGLYIAAIALTIKVYLLFLSALVHG